MNHIQKIEKRILKQMEDKPELFVRVERYQESYIGTESSPRYDVDVYAGWTDDNGVEHTQGITIAHTNIKSLATVAAFLFNDLLNNRKSITIFSMEK